MSIFSLKIFFCYVSLVISSYFSYFFFNFDLLAATDDITYILHDASSFQKPHSSKHSMSLTLSACILYFRCFSFEKILSVFFFRLLWSSCNVFLLPALRLPLLSTFLVSSASTFNNFCFLLRSLDLFRTHDLCCLFLNPIISNSELLVASLKLIHFHRHPYRLYSPKLQIFLQW